MLSVNSFNPSVVSFKAESDPSWVRASKAPAKTNASGMPYIKRSVAGPVSAAALAALLIALAVASSAGS